MGNNSVPKFIFRLSSFAVYRGSVLGRFYCIMRLTFKAGWDGVDWINLVQDRNRWWALVKKVMNLNLRVP